MLKEVRERGMHTCRVRYCYARGVHANNFPLINMVAPPSPVLSSASLPQHQRRKFGPYLSSHCKCSKIMDKPCKRRCTLRLLAISLFVSVGLNIFSNNSEWRSYLDEAIRPTQQNRTAQNDKDMHHLVHVISPYVVKDSDKEAVYFPLDLNQWAAMESIRRALLHVPVGVLKVDVLCAIFESDFEDLSKAGLPCHRFVLLERSTRTEYPNLQPPLDFPFISELIEAATIHLSNSTLSTIASFHVMLTNADIGLSKKLYYNIYGVLRRHDSFSMNRVTVPMENITLTSNTTDLLENQVDGLMPVGGKHPGFDMFCMSSSVLKRITFGDLFLGRPPWGYNVHLMLMMMSDNYINIQSNQYGTFHLGDDTNKWKQNDTSDEEVVKIVTYCPGVGVISNSWSLQNHLNCGRWFLGNQSIPLLSSAQNNNSVPIIYVPGFVRPGYEDLYLERYSNYLSYDELGRPLKHERGPSKKTKAQGTVRTKGWTQVGLG